MGLEAALGHCRHDLPISALRMLPIMILHWLHLQGTLGSNCPCITLALAMAIDV